ncbi:hypothetical protein [Oceanobacillus profundus]|nr:hypothetical protein [Oceanobacillus profundus]
MGWWLILDFSALAARDGVLFLSFWTSRRRGGIIFGATGTNVKNFDH